jgi:hypothetical protein
MGGGCAVRFGTYHSPEYWCYLSRISFNRIYCETFGAKNWLVSYASLYEMNITDSRLNCEEVCINLQQGWMNYVNIDHARFECGYAQYDWSVDTYYHPLIYISNNRMMRWSKLDLTNYDGYMWLDTYRGTVGYTAETGTDPLPTHDTGTGTVAGSVVTDSSKSWSIDQWNGYKVVIANTVYGITDTTATTITLDASPTAGSHSYAIVSTVISGATLTDIHKAWTVNQWANYLLYVNSKRIKILSNTSNTLTVASTIGGDITQTYYIESNSLPDLVLYQKGSANPAALYETEICTTKPEFVHIEDTQGCSIKYLDEPAPI